MTVNSKLTEEQLSEKSGVDFTVAMDVVQWNNWREPGIGSAFRRCLCHESAKHIILTKGCIPVQEPRCASVHFLRLTAMLTKKAELKA